jgi:CxxC motif-containing protein (DUF1111 family)
MVRVILAAVLMVWLGGGATASESDDAAFSRPLPGLDRETSIGVGLGRRLFRHIWPPARPGARLGARLGADRLDGLGPLFNRNACSGCHVKDGRGRPPPPGARTKSMVVRLSLPGAGPRGGPRPHPSYGIQLQDKAIPGVDPEGRVSIAYRETEVRLGDGATVALRAPTVSIEQPCHGPLDGVLLSARVAPAVFGLGLIAALDDSALTALADPNDADGDGISGRLNRVWDAARGRPAIGRFGWKAGQPTLRQQITEALREDIGVTTPTRPDAFRAPELDAAGVDDLVLYVRTLAVPPRRRLDDPKVQRGARLFADIGCGGCHAARLVTGASDLAALSRRTIHPFSDFLLHDMGAALADGRREFAASGREWRTAPLWGLGLIETVNDHMLLLHDGRARGAVEAILWHGGEARAARDAFAALAKPDRDALVAFLKSL